MTKFSTISLFWRILRTKNTTKYRGGRKIYAKISYFSIFLSIKVQNVLYLVGKYDTYKGSTHFLLSKRRISIRGNMILIKSEFWRLGLQFFIIVFTWIHFSDEIYVALCVEVCCVVMMSVRTWVYRFFVKWIIVIVIENAI